VPLLLLVVAILASAILLAFTGDQTAAARLSEQVFSAFAHVLITPLFAIANAVVYVELRLSREGTLAEDIERVFG